MHDPMTQAFEIYGPRGMYLNRKRNKLRAQQRNDEANEIAYPDCVIRIWHVDPEKDGSDDSCGWFRRARHGDKQILKRIRKDFEFEWDSEHSGWFDAEGQPRYSVIAIVLAMFQRAAYTHFGHDWRKSRKFLQKHLYDIISFAENPIDSMHSAITLKYGPERREHRIESAASVVYGCILRWSQPWYRHARWHVHHWRLQIPFVQKLNRSLWTRCAKCGGRFRWGESGVSGSWESKGPRWFNGERGLSHSNCYSPPQAV
jgi:hypothetical protein